MVDDVFSRYIEITGIDVSERNEQENTKETPKMLEANDNVLLFFSYDIVNSSLYKTVNYYGWSIVIDKILEELRAYVDKKMNRAELWRVLGDEIIFIVRITDMDNVHEYVKYIYEILTDVSNKIENGDMFDDLEGFNQMSTELMKLQDVISLKSAAWIARVSDKKDIKNNQTKGHVENIFEIIEGKQNNKFYEFIGSDIDTGFRLVKETRKKRLAVSFELAYLLSEQTDSCKCLNIITYRVLKGVWNNSLYPIIWYYDPSKHDNRKFRNSIPYDADVEDDIYKEYNNDDEKKLTSMMYMDVKRALKKICNDRNLAKKIHGIKISISTAVATATDYINTEKLELHCAAVCYNDEEKILIVKRSKKDVLSEKWEFGCVKASYADELTNTIKKEYKEDFGIEIEVITDSNRNDQQPVPLAIYSIKTRNKEQIHKGVVVLAKILRGKLEINSNKHKEYKFIGEDEVDSLVETECVPDIKDSLKKAFDMIKRLENGK